MIRAAACSTLACGREAAERVLVEQGSAADAVVAGMFAIAGASEGALFAPLVALVAGAGAMGRAFDGRAAQPGSGTARPRGFVVGADVPAAARAAVPRSLHALLLLHASHGRRPLHALVAAGVSEAKAAGALRRAKLLRRIGELGALALATEYGAIVRSAGTLASGLLTEQDLSSARSENVEAVCFDGVAETGEATRSFVEPWAAAPGTATGEAIAAVDAWGLVAVLTLFPTPTGGERAAPLVVPELEVSLPLVAEPVLRGKTRVAPGTVFAVPATLAATDCGADLRAALAVPSGMDPERVAVQLGLRPLDRALAKLARAAPVLAVIATAREARPFSQGPRKASASG